VALLAVGAASAQTPQQNVDQSFALYLAVASGKRSMQSLSPEQRREVQIIAAMMARPRYTSQKCTDLAEKQDEAQSAADDLRNCLAAEDDDCDSQMQEAKDAQEDYEDALDATNDDCQ
jgi:hypothetical protein